MKWQIIALACLGLSVMSLAMWLVNRKVLSIEPIDAPSETLFDTGREVDLASIEQRLLDVGLHPTGALSDLGVDDHLARLEAS